MTMMPSSRHGYEGLDDRKSMCFNWEGSEMYMQIRISMLLLLILGSWIGFAVLVLDKFSQCKEEQSSYIRTW